MRVSTKLFFTFGLILLFSCISFGQTEIMVPDSLNRIGGGTGFLDAYINGDTTATGERNIPDAVYVLKAGGLYYTQNEITVGDWNFSIKSESPENEAVIYGRLNSSGSYPTTLFNTSGTGNITVKDLLICQWDETIPDDISKAGRRIIGVSSIGPSVYVDHCVFSSSGDATIRVGSNAMVVKVTNSIFVNNGNVWVTNPGNGRAFDMRDAACDSLIVENCSFLDGTDRVIRHYKSIGSLKYVKFDHNTVYNWFAMHGGIGLGFVGDHVEITNNIFVDNYVLGNDSTDADRLTEFGETGELGPSGAYRMTFVSSVPNDSTTWTVDHNYYSVSAGLQSFYDSHSAADIGNLIPLTWYINSKIADSTTAFMKEEITFERPTRYFSFYG